MNNDSNDNPVVPKITVPPLPQTLEQKLDLIYTQSTRLKLQSALEQSKPSPRSDSEILNTQLHLGVDTSFKLNKSEIALLRRRMDEFYKQHPEIKSELDNYLSMERKPEAFSMHPSFLADMVRIDDELVFSMEPQDIQLIRKLSQDELALLYDAREDFMRNNENSLQI